MAHASNGDAIPFPFTPVPGRSHRFFDLLPSCL